MSAYYPDPSAQHDSRAPWNDDPYDGDWDPLGEFAEPDPDEAYDRARDEEMGL